MRHSQTAIEDAAAIWLGLRDGGFTLAQEAELAEWMHADPRHAVRVRRHCWVAGVRYRFPILPDDSAIASIGMGREPPCA